MSQVCPHVSEVLRGDYGTSTEGIYVITPLGGMLLVYRPETRGRVVPEGGGSINRNIPTRGVIISL